MSAGAVHTVLLRSDGCAVACGENNRGECDVPNVPGGATCYNPDKSLSAFARPVRVLQLSFSKCDDEDATTITCTSLAGEAVCKVTFPDGALIAVVPGRIAMEFAVQELCVRLMLPDGQLFSSLDKSGQVMAVRAR